MGKSEPSIQRVARTCTPLTTLTIRYVLLLPMTNYFGQSNSPELASRYPSLVIICTRLSSYPPFCPLPLPPPSSFSLSSFQGVTALACTSTNRRLVSGGGEGQVRVWDVTRKGTTSIKETLKEHKGAITCIKITQSDEEVKK